MKANRIKIHTCIHQVIKIQMRKTANFRCWPDWDPGCRGREGFVGWLCWGLTSQSTIFQSYWDGAIASWVINQYFRGVKCLAQGHNTAAVGLEPRTSRSGVRHSTTEPPRSPRGGREGERARDTEERERERGERGMEKEEKGGEWRQKGRERGRKRTEKQKREGRNEGEERTRYTPPPVPPRLTNICFVKRQTFLIYLLSVLHCSLSHPHWNCVSDFSMFTFPLSAMLYIR